MDEPITKSKTHDTASATLLSTEVVVILYSLGAVIGLCFALSGQLGSLQTTNCLLLSWLLALGALAMSVIGDAREEDIEDKDFF